MVESTTIQPGELEHFNALRSDDDSKNLLASWVLLKRVPNAVHNAVESSLSIACIQQGQSCSPIGADWTQASCNQPGLLAVV